MRALVSLLLMACVSDVALQQPSEHAAEAAGEAPVAEFEAPESNALWLAQRADVLVARVEDVEDEAHVLRAAFASDVDGLLGAAIIPDADGRVTWETALSEGAHVLTVTVEDSDGLTGEDQVRLTVGPPNHPPTCLLSAPAEGAELDRDAVVALRGTVGDEESLQLAVTWSSDIDGPLGSTVWQSVGAVALDWPFLSIGPHALNLSAMDEHGDVCTDTIGVAVVQQPPTAPVVAVLPEEPDSCTDGLLCVLVEPSSDPEGDAISYRFDWFADGAPFTSGATTTDHSGDTIGVDLVGTAAHWRCEVTPSDPWDEGDVGADEVGVRPLRTGDALFYEGNADWQTGATLDTFSDVVDDLGLATVRTTVWPTSLDAYGVVLLSMPNLAFAPDQVADLTAFNAQGGTLVLLSEYEIDRVEPSADTLNLLLADLGLDSRYVVATVDAGCPFYATIASADPLTDVSGPISYGATNDLVVGPSAEVLLYGEGGQVLLAREGGVLLSTDTTLFMDTGSCALDDGNIELIENLFEPCPD